MFFPELLLPRHDPRVTIVTDPAMIPYWRALLHRLGREGMIAWDTETSGFDWFKEARIIGHVFGYDLGDGHGPRGVYFPIRHRTADVQLPVGLVTEMVCEILGDPAVTIVGHNLKFDLVFALVDGIIARCQIHDTMIALQLVDENNSKVLEDACVLWDIDPKAHEMKEVVKKVLADEAKRHATKKSEAPGYAWIPVPILGQYGGKDGYNTLGLAQKILPIVHRFWWSLYCRELKLLRGLVRAEWVGMPINIPYLRRVEEVAAWKRDWILREIHRLAGFSLKVTSDDALRDYLYNHLGFPVTHWTKNKDKPDHIPKPATDARALKAMMRMGTSYTGLFQAILDWREQDKIISTYTSPIIERCDSNGVLHCKLDQTGAKTGRLSSKDPNLQNIPTDDEAGIRAAFMTRDGMDRLFLDYSQIELRVLAFRAREPTMTAAFVNGEDIHTRTSLELFHSKDKKWRRIAKVINFGLSYGMSAIGVMENLNETAKPSEGIDYLDEVQAQQFLDRFHARYPRVNEYTSELVVAMLRMNPPQFTNLFGRTRRIHEVGAFGKTGRRGVRMAVASDIQGNAADLAKEGMVRVIDILDKYGATFVLTVHDENQIDVPREAAYECAMECQAVMEDFPQFAPIPIKVEVEVSSTNWSEKKKLEKRAA